MPVICTESGHVLQRAEAGPLPNYIAEYAARLHDTAAPSSQQPVSHAQAWAINNAGLDAVAAKAKASVSAQNQTRRSQLGAEISSFLAAMPCGGTLQTCTPEDLLVYLEQVYIPQHAGSQLPDGTLMGAPCTISNIPSQFRVIFKELGRAAVWDDETASGNPAAASRLSQWRQLVYDNFCLCRFWASWFVMFTSIKPGLVIVRFVSALLRSSSDNSHSGTLASCKLSVLHLSDLPMSPIITQLPNEP